MNSRYWSIVLASLCLPAATSAAPWDLSADVELGVIHSDNITLAGDADEESDTVYTIAPSFALTTEGERTQADLRYSPQAYFYQEFSDEDSVFHIVDANFNTALVQDRLFLTMNGVNYQTSVTPSGALPTSNVPISNNRVDSRILEIRPYWQQSVGSAQMLVQVGYQDLYYDSDTFQGSNQQYAGFSLDNHAEQSGLAWGLNYNYRRMEYDISQPFEYQRAAADLGFWTSSALRLFVSGGAETSFEDILEPNLDEEFWEAGFQYAPNQRLNLELAAGERSYGSSYRGDFSYELRRGTLSITYQETPTTRATTVLNRRPLVARDDLDEILDRPGNADRFIRKRGVVNLGIELNKSELSLRVFTETREGRIDETGMPLSDEDLSGVAARWQWRFGSRTSMNIDADVARRDDGSGDDYDLSRYSLGFDYAVSGRTSLRIEGIRSEEDRKGVGAEYTENQARLLLQIQLR